MGNIKTRFTLLGLALGLELASVSCDKPQPTTQPQPQAQQPPVQQSAPQQPQQTKIKGFYIGMPAAELVDTLKNIGLDNIRRAGEVITVEVPRIAGLAGNNATKSFSYFYMDSATYGKLTELTIDGYTVDLIFGSGGMNEKEFSDTLSDANKLPKFEFRFKPSNGCEYKCVTQDGIKITVSGDKGHEKELDMSASTDDATKRNFK